VIEKPQALPEGVACLPPGPGLAAVLAGVDLSRLAPGDVFTVLAAQARLVAHDQARLLAVLWEAGRVRYDEAAGPLSRSPELGRFSADEAAFTLHWSAGGVQSLQHLAQDLITRLPAVYQALTDGRLDLPRARAFSDGLAGVDDPTATAIVDRLITPAQKWTLAQLRDRIRYRVGKAAPDAAKQRFARSVADRSVYAHLDDDATATLSGLRLPPQRAAAAYDRVDTLARAAKADGDPRTLNQLRADTYLDLLTGIAFATHPSRDPITHTADLTHTAEPAAPARAQPTGAGAEPAPADTAAGRRRGPVADAQWLSWVGFTDADGRPFTTTPASDPAGGRPAGAGGWSRGGWRPSTPAAPAPVRLAAGVDPAWAAALTGTKLCTCGGLRPPARGGVHIEVKLSTLLCLDDDPALIPGWGPVIADIARQVAHEQETTPPWYWSVVDHKGHLFHHGHTRRRPTRTEAGYIKARDRTCRAPGCRRPALWCDLDHRQQYAHGGASHRANICSLCPRHHTLRHEHGFTYHHVGHGSYLIQSPTGQIWLVGPDGDLILTAEDDDPGPPPEYADAVLGRINPDDLPDPP